MSPRVFRSVRLTLLGLGAAWWMLAISAAPALPASPNNFGETGSGTGQFAEPNGIGVDQTSGDVYIADRNNQRIDEFSAEGQWLRSWGWGVADGSTAAFQTCTTTCFAGLPGSGGGQFRAPGLSSLGASGVAIDNSGGPSQEDVYVVDTGNHRVQKFGPNGEFLLAFGREVNAGTKGDVCLAGEECQEAVAGAEEGEFTFDTRGQLVAVGPTGSVYVGDETRVQRFSEDGVFEAQFELQKPEVGKHGFGAKALAVNGSGDIYVVEAEAEELSGNIGPTRLNEYEPSGKLVRTLDAGGKPQAVTLDALGDVVLDESAPQSPTKAHHIVEFSPAGAELASFDSGTESSNGRGIAFADLAQELYVVNQGLVRVLTIPAPGPLIIEGSESAGAIQPKSALLHATINPEGNDTTYKVEYGTSLPYSASAPVPEADLGTGFEEHEVAVQLTNLSVRTAYHYRFVATNECELEPVAHPGVKSTCVTDGPDETFTTLPPALVDSESVSDVAATSATLEGAINPLGSNTSYRFTYGPTAVCGGSECSVPVPEGDVGSGQGDVVLAPEHIQGLAPATTYHYRLIAVNALGTEEGELKSFTTQSEAPFALPDGRAWELVSPPDKRGALLEGINEFGGGLLQAAADGSAFTFVADAPTEEGPPGYDNSVQVFSTRGSEGWSSRDIPIPHETATGFSFGTSDGSEYRFFSEDLSVGIVQPFGGFDPQVSPEASEQTPYLHIDFLNGNVREPCVSSCFIPILTKEDVTSGRAFSTKGLCPVSNEARLIICAPEFEDASPDGAHVVLHSSVILTSAPGDNGGLYEWSAGKPQPEQLELVSILPGNVDAPAAILGSKGQAGETLSRENAISADGSRIFFTSNDLYLRDLNRDETIQIGVGATFEGANRAGTRVRYSGQECEVRLSGSKLECVAINPETPLEGEGLWQAIVTKQPLTGYDNRDARTGALDSEVYLFDPISKTLVCASCDPTGARPIGPASVPGPTGFDENTALYQSRFLNAATGRLFFDSADALVPQDVNGTQDVYEWEPANLGGCSEASVTFSSTSGGCVSLISSGASAETSSFLDASESGGDVFFLTTARLSGRDTDTSVDVYDAHECTTTAPCPAPAVQQPPPCTTADSCRAAPTPGPEIFGAPASTTFAGPGNLQPAPPPKQPTAAQIRAEKLAKALKGCRAKHNRRKRTSCESKARKRYGPVRRAARRRHGQPAGRKTGT